MDDLLGKLNPETVLEIAERLDSKTLCHFMQVDKAIRGLIKRYEHSICKSRARSICPVPPTGNILSSVGFQRNIIPHNSFQQTLELERRASCLEAVLESCRYFRSTAALPISPAAETKRMDYIRKAYAHCNAISDVAARFPGQAIMPQAYDHLQDYVYHQRAEAGEIQAQDPSAILQARPQQLQYIKTLSLEDCLALRHFIDSLAMAIPQEWNFGIGDYPEVFDRVKESCLVLKECFLRHGLWFLLGKFGECDHYRHLSFTIQQATGMEYRTLKAGNGANPKFLLTQLDECLGKYLDDTTTQEEAFAQLLM